MISSTSSSADVRRALLTLTVVAALSGCAGGRSPPTAVLPTPGPRPKVLVLPPENLVNGPLPSREVTSRLEQTVTMAGADVVGGDRLSDYLARYRIRYTGGVNPVAAKAAREELGADAILVTSVVLWGGTPPQAALVSRLVSTADAPVVLWTDGFARAGDDSPGIFGLNVITDPLLLQAEALQQIRLSLEAYLTSGKRGERCSVGGWWRPRVAYRARPDERTVASVAVLPFVNETRRRGAGEILALLFANQLANAEGFRIVEPGIVRDELLRRRVVMEDGVSLDQARVVSATLDADLVLAGSVFDFEDGGGTPHTNFSILVIDRKTGRVVWESISYDKGTDSETVFGLRRVSNAPLLTCRMAREVIDGMAGVRPVPGR